ncbi:MAG: serine hydrolase [Thermoanaerobaculia bacterium]
MKKLKIVMIVALILTMAIPALANFREFEKIPVDPQLQAAVDAIARRATTEFAGQKLTPEDFAISLVDLTDPAHPRRASFHGDVPFYPASVVKLFFLVDAWHQIDARTLVPDEEMKRGLRDMIVQSSNDATSYVVDRITRTTSGPNLYGRKWRIFEERRFAPTRWFREMGYDVSAAIKTFCEGPYGREVELLGPNYENRNHATADAIASLETWIARKEAVSPEASEAMLALMHRTVPADDPGVTDEQVIHFLGQTLPAGSELWSKAGWTSTVWHDAAIVQLPTGQRYVAVVMTRNAVDGDGIFAALSEWIRGAIVTVK